MTNPNPVAPKTKKIRICNCGLGCRFGCVEIEVPVAPKTDTPATQFPVPCPDCGGSGQVSDDATCWTCKGEGSINLEPLAARAYAELEESHTNVCRRLQGLESTLAAERASRVQADTEQFNAGWNQALEEAKEAIGPYTHAIHAIRALSKPSVSPEQEKP